MHAVWMNGGRPADALDGGKGGVEPRDLQLRVLVVERVLDVGVVRGKAFQDDAGALPFRSRRKASRSSGSTPWRAVPVSTFR